MHDKIKTRKIHRSGSDTLCGRPPMGGVRGGREAEGQLHRAFALAPSCASGKILMVIKCLLITIHIARC